MLCGARRTPVPASALLDGDTLEVLGAAARAAVAAGFRVAKVKVEPTTPVETMVRALRAAAPGLRLRLDANGCWTAAEALAACGTLDPAAVEWVEQPLAAAPAEPRLAELAAVRRRLPVPLALDESVTSAVSVGAIAAAGAADVIVLKLAQVGGLGAALAAARAARNAGLGVTVTTSIDTGIATAAALHLASVLDGGLACGVATSGLLAGDVVREGMPPRPRMAPPPGPGLGVTLDPAALARFRVPEAA
jgi:O-succinylbenzoate synthase